MTEESENKIEIPEYEVVVTMKNGNYVCQIPDLMLVATGKDLESIYRELMGKKEKFFKEVDQANIEIDLTPTATKWHKRNSAPEGFKLPGGDFKSFFIKMGVSCLAAIIILMFSVQFINTTLDGVVNKNLNKISRNVDARINIFRAELQKFSAIPSSAKKMEKDFYKAIDKPINLKKQEKDLVRFRKLIKKLRPFVNEIKPLFAEETISPKEEN